MTTLDDIVTVVEQYATERTGPLQQQVDDLTAERTSLQASLATAQSNSATDAATISTLQQRVDALTAELAKLQPEDPAPPFLVGMAYGNNTDPTTWEQRTGVTVALRRTYHTLTSVDAILSLAAKDVAAGRTPYLSVKLPGDDWTGAAAGKYDTDLQRLADGLDALGAWVYLAVHHEPEGDGTIAAFQQLQAHVAPLFNRGRILFGVCVTGYHQLYGTKDWPLDQLWSEGTPIKFLSVDVYQSYRVSKSTWTDLRTAYWQQVSDFAKAKGIPWGVAETGLADAAWSETPQLAQVATWFHDMPTSVRDLGGSHWCYFNTAGADAAHSWTCKASSTKEGALVKAMREHAPA